MNESLTKLGEAFAEERLRISTHKRPGEIRDCGICGPVLESTDAAFTAVGMEMDELKRARDDARRERDSRPTLAEVDAAIGGMPSGPWNAMHREAISWCSRSIIELYARKAREAQGA